MNFVYNGIVDNLMEQKNYIKYYLFHDVIIVVKSKIFKFKTINIYYSYFVQPQFQL